MACGRRTADGGRRGLPGAHVEEPADHERNGHYQHDDAGHGAPSLCREFVPAAPPDAPAWEAGARTNMDQAATRSRDGFRHRRRHHHHRGDRREAWPRWP